MRARPQESKPAPAPMASAKGDVRQLKSNTSATVAELKAFLAQLQGKSPQEMLGVVAASRLARAVGIACGIVFASIVVFTAVPFAMGSGKKEQPAQKDEPDPTSVATPATVPPPSPPPGDPQNPPAGVYLSPLGVGEEKQAPPTANPLEDTDDNFLDGLE